MERPQKGKRTVCAPIRSRGWNLGQIIAPFVVIVAMSLSIFSQIHPFPAPPFSSAPVIALVWFGVSILWAIFSRPAVTSRSAVAPTGGS